MHESPKACFNISKVSLPILPNLTQNLMHTLCSSTSAIPPISGNCRQLMQYTHKDTCNNQTLPHPTTPLGTLTHKTPPQHTLAGNSWTTSDLHVMSIVLGLLDTSSYWWSEANTHTHKGPSDKSLFLHKAPSVKFAPPSPALLRQENATEKYQFRNFGGSTYWHLCFSFFHFSVSWSSDVQFGVIYLKTWGGTQPYVASSTLEICSCFFVFGRTYMAPNSLTLHKPVSVVACVKSF